MTTSGAILVVGRPVVARCCYCEWTATSIVDTVAALEVLRGRLVDHCEEKHADIFRPGDLRPTEH